MKSARMRAATVVCRYHTTTRRADSAAIAHARAETTSPSAGSVHPRTWARTPMAMEGAIQSTKMRDPQTGGGREPPARQRGTQHQRARPQCGRVTRQDAVSSASRWRFHGCSEKCRRSTCRGSTARGRKPSKTTSTTATAAPARSCRTRKPTGANSAPCRRARSADAQPDDGTSNQAQSPRPSYPAKQQQGTRRRTLANVPSPRHMQRPATRPREERQRDRRRPEKLRRACRRRAAIQHRTHQQQDRDRGDRQDDRGDTAAPGVTRGGQIVP